MSTYEGEHMIFGLLGQADLTQNDAELALFKVAVLVLNALSSFHRRGN
jgi:hypothetical protein